MHIARLLWAKPAVLMPLRMVILRLLEEGS